MKLEISTSVPWLLVLLAAASSITPVLGWLLTRGFRGQSAALRHFLWLMALAVPLAAMPVAWMHPRIVLHVLRAPVAEARPAKQIPAPVMPTRPAPFEGKGTELPIANGGSLKPIQSREETPQVAVPVNCWWALWGSGVVLCMIPLLRSHRKARELMARDCVPASGGLRGCLEVGQSSLGSTRSIRLLVSRRDGIPFSYGILRPTIVMPQSWQQWEEERIDLCLTHELAHLLRGDLISLLVAQVATVLCWFNPLVRIAAGKLREEAECAADDLVLSRNIRPEAYAASLVSIAEAYHAGGPYLAAALPMAQPNRLKQRVHAILDGSLSRKAPRRATKLALGLLGFGALVVALSVEVAAAVTAPLETFKAFMAQRQAALSKLDSFQLEGTITVTTSDEYLKMENSGAALALRKKQGGEAPKKVNRWRFRIWGKGDRIKEISERLDDSGKVFWTDTYYLTAHTNTWVQQPAGKPSSAHSAPLELGPNYGIYTCPAFMELAFLHRGITNYGIPALSPSQLSAPEKWELVRQSLQPQASDAGGLTPITITGTTTVLRGYKMTGTTKEVELWTTKEVELWNSEGSCLVDLAKGSTGQPQVKSITFMEKENGQTYVGRKVNVLEYFHDPALGDIGKKFQVGVAFFEKDKPGVTWDFDIESFRTNCPVADSEVAYAGDTGFYDGDDATRRDHVQKAVAILDELRDLDLAIDQWAIKNKKKAGDRMTPADLLPFATKGTPLYDALKDPAGPKDLLGNPLGPLVVDAIPKVDPKTSRALSDAVNRDFWTPFIAK